MKTNFRKFLTVGSLVAAITLQTATSAMAAPAPGSVRSLDGNSDRLLSSVREDYNDMGKRERYGFRNTMDAVQDFENAVDRLRSAVENRSGYRSIQGNLAVVNDQFRQVERGLSRRGLSRETRADLQRSREALAYTNRALSSGWNDRDDRHDHRGRGWDNDRRRGEGVTIQFR